MTEYINASLPIRMMLLVTLIMIGGLDAYYWRTLHQSTFSVTLSRGRRQRSGSRWHSPFAMSRTDAGKEVNEGDRFAIKGKRKKAVSVTKRKVQEKKEQLKKEAASKQLTMYNRDFVELDLYEMFNSSTIKALLNIKDEVSSFFMRLEQQLESLRLGIQAKVERDIRVTRGAGDFVKRSINRGTSDILKLPSKEETSLSFPTKLRSKSKLMGNFGAATTKQRSKQLRKRRKKRGVGAAGGVDTLYRSVRVLPNKLQYDYNRRIIAREANANYSRGFDISRNLPSGGITTNNPQQIEMNPELPSEILNRNMNGVYFDVDADIAVASADSSASVAIEEQQFLPLSADASRTDALLYLFDFVRQGSMAKLISAYKAVNEVFSNNAAFQLLLSKPDENAPFSDFDALFTAENVSNIATVRKRVTDGIISMKICIAACERTLDCFQKYSSLELIDDDALFSEACLQKGDLPIIAGGSDEVSQLRILASQLLDEVNAKSSLNDEDVDEITIELLASVNDAVGTLETIPLPLLEKAAVALNSVDAILSRSPKQEEIISAMPIPDVLIDTDIIDAVVDTMDEVTLIGDDSLAEPVSEAVSTVVLDDADIVISDVESMKNNFEVDAIPSASSSISEDLNLNENAFRFDASASSIEAETSSSQSDVDYYIYSGTELQAYSCEDEESPAEAAVVIETTAESVESKEDQVIAFVVTAFDVTLFLIETLVKAVGPAVKTGGVQVGKRILSTYYWDEFTRPSAPRTRGGDDIRRENWQILDQFINWKKLFS